VLLGGLWQLQSARLDGQALHNPTVIVMCGDCPGSLFSLTAERGMLLMKAGNDGGGDLWFYPFTPGSKPLMVGLLPTVGKPIQWAKHQP
jgi:hypothetical protein